MAIRIWEMFHPWNDKTPPIPDIRGPHFTGAVSGTYAQHTTDERTQMVVVQADEAIRVAIGNIGDGTESGYFYLKAYDTREFLITGGQVVGYRTA